MKKKKQITSVSIHSFSKKTDLFFSSLLGIFAPILYPSLHICYHHFYDR